MITITTNTTKQETMHIHKIGTVWSNSLGETVTEGWEVEGNCSGGLSIGNLIDIANGNYGHIGGLHET